MPSSLAQKPFGVILVNVLYFHFEVRANLIVLKTLSSIFNYYQLCSHTLHLLTSHLKLVALKIRN